MFVRFIVATSFDHNRHAAQRKQSKHNRSSSAGGSGDEDVFFYDMISYRELDLGRRLGSGSFGTVYKATWKGRTVAAKVLNQPSRDTMRSIRNEINIFSRLDNPYIIEFVGACAFEETLVLCTEYATFGSLYSFLYDSDCTYDLYTALRFSTEIAKGMTYLASMGILHRDLKSPNILLTDATRVVHGGKTASSTPVENVSCKICDFGLSKMGSLITSVGVSGTIRWMAPEVMQDEPTSEKTDVYSFGMVLWEIFVRKLPFGRVNLGAIIYNVVRNHARPLVPKRVPDDIRALMTACWGAAPDSRPTFAELVVALGASKMVVDVSALLDEVDEDSEEEEEVVSDVEGADEDVEA